MTAATGYNPLFAAAAVAALAAACSQQPPSGAPDSGGDTDTFTDTETGTETGSGLDTDTGTGEWVNPGCDAEPNVVENALRLDLEIDLSEQADGLFHVEEAVTLTPQQAGEAISLFVERVELGEASCGYSYDDHMVTFCPGPFEAGQDVTVEASFTVDDSISPPLPVMGDWGLHRRMGDDLLAIGPFNEPYYAPYWMMVPQSIHGYDAEHDDSGAVQSLELTVIVPDEEWIVIGPGGPGEQEGPGWSFSLAQPQPIYAVSFVASPDLELFDVGQSASGVQVTGAVTPQKMEAAEVAFPAAITTIDWMEDEIGPYEFGEHLYLVEVPDFGGGMEHTTAIWLGSDTITPDTAGDFIVVHETVHHWWGDNVRFSDWPHFWLAEGFDEWSTNFNIMGELLSPADFEARKLSYRIEGAESTHPWLDILPTPGPLCFDEEDDMINHFLYDMQLYYKYGAVFLAMVDSRLQRDFDTELATLLADWFAERHLSEATTEDFLAFLESATADDGGYWQALFDDWVYATPCPEIELGDYSLAGGEASATVARVDGAGQSLIGLEIVFVVDGVEHSASVDLPSGVDSAVASAAVPGEPDRIAVDPDLFYVLVLGSEDGWSGPEVGFTVEPL